MASQASELVEAFRQLAEKPGAAELRCDFLDVGDRTTWRICGGAPKYTRDKFRSLAARAGELLPKRAIAGPVDRWLTFLRETCPGEVEYLAVGEDCDDAGQLLARVSLGTILEPIRASETAVERLKSSTVRNRSTKRRRRGGSPRKPRPLTVLQTEAVQIVGECRGNISAAAKRLGKDRTTVSQAYKAGLFKLGKQPIKHGTRTFARDRRGQAILDAENADRRR